MYRAVKDRTTADQKEHRGRFLIYLNLPQINQLTKQKNLKNILIIPKIFGRIFCGLTRQNLNLLEESNVLGHQFVH